MRVLRRVILVLGFVYAALPSWAAANSCRDLFGADKADVTADPKPTKEQRRLYVPLFRPESKLKREDLVTKWMLPIEMGYHDKWIARDRATGRRKIVLVTPDNHENRSYGNLELMPGAPDGGSTYYAVMTYSEVTRQTSAELHNINESNEINSLIDRHLELTWSKYAEEQTVSAQEIGEFKKTEAQLSPQRKISFVTTDLKGRTLTVMRVYDGSPYPALFLGDAGMHLEAPLTDPRLPVERRYPYLNFREKSDYIFETGRLSKVDEIDGALEYQLYNFGAYLRQKFGARGLSPSDFAAPGRNYIEITGRHAAYYLRERARGGAGWHLFAVSRAGGPMKKTTKVNREQQLQDIRKDKDAKLILYLSPFEVVDRFFEPTQLDHGQAAVDKAMGRK